MKKTICILTTLLLMSCNDMLKLEPKDEYADTAVFGDLSLMETFINDIYWNAPHGLGETSLSEVTDETQKSADRGLSHTTNAIDSPSEIPGWENNRHRVLWQMLWPQVYQQVRATNLFLERAAEVSFDNDADNARLTRLIGEVHFLRAYYYHILAFMYGGVPIISEPYGLTDDHLAARNTFEETIDFIVDDLDIAASLLPLSHEGSDYGRAARGAALALKSRVLLYAASDLYHDVSWAGGYANPELVSYTGGNREDYWRAARDAAKAVMDLNIYDLHYPSAGDPVNHLSNNYEEIFLLKETNEDIYIRSFISSSEGAASGGFSTYNPNLFLSSPAYLGWGRQTPLGQSVDAYEMADGSKFDWDNPVHAANPYENRDPRFYANILYHDAPWRERSSAMIGIDPVGRMQTAYHEQSDGSFSGGIDTRDGPINNHDCTFTGYYLRKFLDPSVEALFEVQEAPWRFIRYTEILLNYAEASAELGEDAEARGYINEIRERAGMPDINSSGDELLEDVRHERRIELMFEQQRHFDIRRWMIAPEVFGTINSQGVDIRYVLGEEDPTYTVIDVRSMNWSNNGYFMPIKQEEMNRNEKLIQNPLY